MELNNYNLKNLLIWAQTLFIKHKLYFGHGSINAWDEAVFIASYVLDLNLYETNLKDQLLTKQQVDLFIKTASLRAKKKIPLSYIIKTAWFASKKYYVDRRVIIPRSPFAELINNRFNPWLKVKSQPKRILDLCTGSGCIAIACYHEFSKNNPLLRIDASDISSNALKVAKKNLKLHKLSASQIKLIKSDLFNNIPKIKYDLIVSNPPYIDEITFSKLPKEFHFEPKLALVSKENGLQIVIKILQQANQFLTKQGILVVEVGNMWKKLIKLKPRINFTWIELKNGGEGIFVLTKEQLDNYV